jgi:hypothetical protein
MTSNATVTPPTNTAARRYSEQIHALVDRQTRELILGLALLDAESGGYARPREGETIRTLLDDAIARLYRRDGDAYGAAVIRGRRELDDRERERAARQAETSAMVAAVGTGA